MRTHRWWTGLSPRRRILLGGLALVVAVAAVVVGLRVSQGQPEAVPGRPGAVLLVPGYGGSTTSLDELAARIRGTGRTATVVQLAGNGTGDLTAQARVLDGYVNRAIGAGSGPVTVIGYSAGGVVAWLWYLDYGGATRAGKIITLGAPLHGARVAAVGTAYDPAECPVACEQLAPGSALLTRLQQSTQARPPWLSLWSTDDQTVQPPDSARLPGAVNVPLQSVCPGADIQHSQLPTAPLVVGLVLRALAGNRVTALAPSDCASLESLGRAASRDHEQSAPHMVPAAPTDLERHRPSLLLSAQRPTIPPSAHSRRIEGVTSSYIYASAWMSSSFRRPSVQPCRSSRRRA